MELFDQCVGNFLKNLKIKFSGGDLSGQVITIVQDCTILFNGMGEPFFTCYLLSIYISVDPLRLTNQWVFWFSHT